MAIIIIIIINAVGIGMVLLAIIVYIKKWYKSEQKDYPDNGGTV